MTLQQYLPTGWVFFQRRAAVIYQLQLKHHSYRLNGDFQSWIYSRGYRNQVYDAPGVINYLSINMLVREQLNNLERS